MNKEVTLLKKEDIEEYFNLKKYCFQGYPDILNKWSLNKYFNAKDMYGIFIDKKIACACTIRPLEVGYCGKKVLAGGLGGLVTAPEYRNKKLAPTIINELLYEMKNRRYTFSILDPFSKKYYQKFGFENAFFIKNYSYNINALREFSSEEGEFKKVTLEDTKEMLEAYKGTAKKYQLSAYMTEEMMKNKIENRLLRGYFIYRVIINNESRGYISLDIKDDRILVIDMFYRDLETLKSILGFLSRHSSQVSNIEFVLAEDENLEDIISMEFEELKLLQKKMLRVIDVKKALENREIDSKYNLSYIIKINDNIINENNDTFEVVINNGSISVKNTEKESQLEINIGPFSQMVVGSRSLDQLIKTDKIIINKDFSNELYEIFVKKSVLETEGY